MIRFYSHVSTFIRFQCSPVRYLPSSVEDYGYPLLDADVWFLEVLHGMMLNSGPWDLDSHSKRSCNNGTVLIECNAVEENKLNYRNGRGRGRGSGRERERERGRERGRGGGRGGRWGAHDNSHENMQFWLQTYMPNCIFLVHLDSMSSENKRAWYVREGVPKSTIRYLARPYSPINPTISGQ